MKKSPIIHNPSSTISIETFDKFLNNPGVTKLIEDYREKYCPIYASVISQILYDLNVLNETFLELNRHKLFAAFESRLKNENSTFKKLYGIVQDKSSVKGISNKLIENCFKGIKDIAGVRFYCRYFDDVRRAVKEVKDYLIKKGYGRLDNLDKDLLDNGDPENKYRSYHFYMNVPIQLDIFGKTSSFICEIQARTELQHVWAVISHELFYEDEKNKSGFYFPSDAKEDMKAISDSLHSADIHLKNIRERVKKPLATKKKKANGGNNV